MVSTILYRYATAACVLALLFVGLYCWWFQVPRKAEMAPVSVVALCFSVDGIPLEPTDWQLAETSVTLIFEKGAPAAGSCSITLVDDERRAVRLR